MKYYASNAYIIDKTGHQRPLLLKEMKIVDVEPETTESGFILSPMVCASLFLVLCVVMGWLQWKNVGSGGAGISCFMLLRDWPGVSLPFCFSSLFILQ